jgi:hypothetical protein
MVQKKFPRDAWIVGHGCTDDQRTYVIHTNYPRFIARVVEIDQGQPEEFEGAADTFHGITFLGDDICLCEMIFYDDYDDYDNLEKLILEAYNIYVKSENKSFDDSF